MTPINAPFPAECALSGVLVFPYQIENQADNRKEKAKRRHTAGGCILHISHLRIYRLLECRLCTLCGCRALLAAGTAKILIRRKLPAAAGAEPPFVLHDPVQPEAVLDVWYPQPAQNSSSDSSSRPQLMQITF